MALALKGTIVRLTKSRPKEVIDGTLYVTDEGRIAAVKKKNQAAPSGFAGVKVLDLSGAFIYPGLIDLHSHIGYNSLPLWVQPGEKKPFKHHDIWPNRKSYRPKISWPGWVLAKAAPEALMTYVQVRALAGGTTGIQGWPTTNRTPANQLLRNVDDQRFVDEHSGSDNMRTSALTLDRDALRSKARDLSNELGFIYHCAEGRTESLVVREFEDLARTNCLRRRLIAIHCNAIGESEFKQWKERAALADDDGPGAIVWSPFSNLWLYGQTTNVIAARKQGISVCLGTDWGPSGTKNLLGELKVARIWSDAQGWDLDDFDLVEMVTANPGDALSRVWGKQVGRLVHGALADLTVITRKSEDPWENLVRAKEQQVQAVFIGGQPRYGTKKLMDAGGIKRTTSVSFGRVRRRVALFDPKDEDKPEDERAVWTWSKVLKRMDAVRKDPVGTVNAADQASASGSVVRSARGPDDNKLIMNLDMPGGPAMAAGKPPSGVKVEIPKTPSLHHDRRWLHDVVTLKGFHDGLLDRLRDFF